MKFQISARTALFALIAGLVFLVFFGWVVLTTAQGTRNHGSFGRAAMTVAGFPGLVTQAWQETKDRISGREAYWLLSVPAETDATGYTPLEVAEGLPPVPLATLGDRSAAARGWRMVGGAFSFPGGIDHAVLLIDPDFTVRRIWHLDEAAISDMLVASQSRKILHGLAVLDDLSLVLSFDHGSTLQRFDACGARMWSIDGLYSHTVTANTDTGTLWTTRLGGFDHGSATPANGGAPNEGFVEVGRDGAILREISMRDVIAANPDLSLFEIPRHEANLVETNSDDLAGQWAPDSFHFNDVDPLPAALAGAFPGFAAGDLLISARTLNTVFVLDPDTLQVKWFLTGLTRRQHDPDWNADGTITVYDNRMNRAPSAIVRIHPDTNTVEPLFDGAQNGFYSRIRGKHMFAGDGSLLVVSPQQGRLFEIGPNDDTILDYLNPGPEGTGRNMVMTEFLWFPEDAIDLQEAPCANP